MKERFSAVYCFDIKEYIIFSKQEEVGYFNPTTKLLSLWDENNDFINMTAQDLKTLQDIMSLEHEEDE